MVQRVPDRRVRPVITSQTARRAALKNAHELSQARLLLFSFRQGRDRSWNVRGELMDKRCHRLGVGIFHQDKIAVRPGHCGPL
jgi:hypothetical protein